MNQKIIIAIDGFSSTGKSTLAKQLAKALGYIYVDTGAMYRAVTLYAMQRQFINKETFKPDQLVAELSQISLNFQFNKTLGFAEMFLNGINVEQKIRTLEVSRLVSNVAAISEVRRKLVDAQQEMGKNKGIVMDGRDIGTVVFPNAELKIFMTASPETRAKRRFEELIKKGDEVSYKDVLQNVEERDYIDSTRKDSPLIKAENAIEFDNSEIDLKTQFQTVLAFVHEQLKKE